MGKKSLGRGLDAIFQDHALPEYDGGESEGVLIQKIPLHEIDPNPYQPRRVFADEDILELAETIQEHGLIQPITVRKHCGRYQIVSGERRTRAARLAGFEEIDARVYEMLSDKTMSEWAIIENIQRVDLNPVETAQSYQQLLENYGYTHEDLAKRLGKSRAVITNSLRLLKLPASVLVWIEEGKLSQSAARALLSPDISDPEAAARKIIEEGLSVRDAEKLPKPKQDKKEVKLDPHFQQIIQDIQYALGTRVKIQGKNKEMSQGSLLIEYESLQDLGRIRDFLASLPV